MAFMKFLYRLSSSSIDLLLVEPCIRRGVLGVVRDDILVLGHAAAVQAVLPIAACTTLGGGPVRDAVPARRVETEQLGADALVLEAGGRAPIPAALGVQRQQCPRQGPS